MKESTLFSTLEKSCGSPPHATLQPSPIICNGPPDHSLLWPLHMCSLPRETHTPISIEWGRERNCSTERKDKAQLQSGWVSGGRNEQQYQCVVKTYKVKKNWIPVCIFPQLFQWAVATEISQSLSRNSLVLSSCTPCDSSQHPHPSFALYPSGNCY